MQFGTVGSCWQPLIPEGQALGEVCLAGCVWEACTRLPVLCKWLARLSSVPFLEIGALVFHKIEALNGIKGY